MAVDTASSATAPSSKPTPVSGLHVTFVIAWFFFLLFYFLQYAVCSVPSVMIPEFTSAFGLTTLGVSSLLGFYYYTYSTFAIVAGQRADARDIPNWRRLSHHRGCGRGDPRLLRAEAGWTAHKS